MSNFKSNGVCDMESIVDLNVQKLWGHVVTSCNRVLHHAEVYGFQLMDLPDPNIHQMANVIDTVVLPVLDELARRYDFSPESGMKVANIRTYAMHLRAINIAIKENDSVAYYKNVDLLMAEPMIY